MNLYYTCLSAVLLFALSFTGCGGSEVLLHPNYSVKEITSKKISAPRVKISQVVDQRTSDNKTIGAANVGLFNKTVPYRVSVPLNEFIQHTYDTLFSMDEDSAAISVIVYVDTFTVGEYTTLFGEYGRLEAKLFFGVRNHSDSIMYITTRFDESVKSGIDVTNMLEPLVYTGIADCGTQFAKKALEMNIQPQRYQQGKTDSLVALPAGVQPQQIARHAIEATELQAKPKTYSDVGAMYSSGGKVKTGVRIFYNTLFQKDSSRNIFGFGYNIEVLDIDNTRDGFMGTMITYGGNIVLRALFSEAPNTAYIGLQGTLSFGNETIDYGTKKESSFYFGPILRQTIGITLNKKVYFDIGVFEMLLLGSKLLPNDAGITAGISIGI